jgi:hypothetical protein
LERGGWSVVGRGPKGYLTGYLYVDKIWLHFLVSACLVEPDGCYCLVRFSFDQTTINNAPTATLQQ